MKGLQSANWYLKNSHRDVSDSMGNIVSNVVTTLNRAGEVSEIPRGLPCKLHDGLATVLCTWH